MLIKITVFLVAIGLGLGMSFSLIFISKFKEYVSAKKKTNANYWKIVDFSWRISLPVFFGFICFILLSHIRLGIVKTV